MTRVAPIGVAALTVVMHVDRPRLLHTPRVRLRAHHRRGEMAADEMSHAAFVRAWMNAGASDVEPEVRLALFERALASLWQRAVRTLGAVTLGAIADRVLYDVSAEFPLVSAIAVDATGFRVESLRERGELEGLDGAMERTLIDLLTVIGNLTADILTPGLHAALSSVSLDATAANDGGGSKT